MHWLAAAAIVALVHVTGALQVIAPVLGNIGTIISTTDKAFADVIGVRKYLAERSVQKNLPIKPVSVPKSKPKQ